MLRPQTEPPLLWAICKELLADKAVDIVFRMAGIKADNIRDAVKAAVIGNAKWF
jgi:hypothetical protein